MNIEHFDNDLKANVKQLYEPFDPNKIQENKILKENNKRLFTPEFIPYYLKEVKAFNLSKNEALVYGFVRFYMTNTGTGARFYFTNEDLEDILKINANNISKALSKLQKNGLVSRSHSMKAGGGLIRFVTEVKNLEGVILAKLQKHEFPNMQKRELGNMQKREGNNNKIKDNKKNIYIDQQVDRVRENIPKQDATQLLFSKFWESYPRHIAKKKALELFSRLSPELQQQIIEILPKYKFSSDPQFIPHPATWLYQHRWEDEQFIDRTRIEKAKEINETENFSNFIDNLLNNKI